MTEFILTAAERTEVMEILTNEGYWAYIRWSFINHPVSMVASIAGVAMLIAFAVMVCMTGMRMIKEEIIKNK